MDALGIQGGSFASAIANRGDAQLKSLQSKMNSLSPDQIEKIEKTAEDFESVFVSQMLQHMFSGIKVNETFGGGKGEEVFNSMMIEQYGKQIASQGGMGIADQVKATLIDIQSQQTTVADLQNNTAAQAAPINAK